MQHKNLKDGILCKKRKRLLAVRRAGDRESGSKHPAGWAHERGPPPPTSKIKNYYEIKKNIEKEVMLFYRLILIWLIRRGGKKIDYSCVNLASTINTSGHFLINSQRLSIFCSM